MKKLFLLLLPGLLLLAGSAKAQFERGTKYWGATVNFSGQLSRDENEFDDTDVSKTSNPIIKPEAQLGWFVSRKTMLGLGLRYGLNFQKTDYKPADYDYRSFNQSLQLLPFIRQYYGLNDRWAIFIHGELGPNYSWSKIKNGGLSPSTEKSDYWQYGLAVKPGVVYTFPNKKWSLEAYTNFLSLNFNYLPAKDGRNRQFDFSTGLSSGFPSYFSLRIARFIQPKN